MDRRDASRLIGRGALALAATTATTTAAMLGLPRPAGARILPADVLDGTRAPAAGGPAGAGPALAPTPAMTEGPFYPPAFTAEPARRLYRGTAPAFGRPMRLAGRVVDVQGRPLAGARIEIWQCDARGHYHHPRDRGADNRDPDFAGFGWQAVDAGGRYGFATIVPVPYPGRTPHVHVRIRHQGRILLTSQIFLPEEVTANDEDFLWRSLSPSDRARVAGTDVPARPDDPGLQALAAVAAEVGGGADRLLLCDLVTR